MPNLIQILKRRMQELTGVDIAKIEKGSAEKKETKSVDKVSIISERKGSTMKKLPMLLVLFVSVATTFAQTTVQVVMPECVNISGNEASWLPGQIQDKLKSNLQEYLGMKTVVDSKSEAILKKLQRESENGGRDDNTAIELGKISTAKFAVMTKIRKTGKGYSISTDYTDMTTGEQKATAISKEYKTTDELYGDTGAIDEITLILSEKLNIAISSIQKQVLKMGLADFSIDDQLKLAKQNEETFKKMMAQYDSDLAKLSVSNDLSAIENKRKIEAEKALLVEKQNAERKRQAELKAQKQRAEQDAKLEAERSIALKTQRDEMAKQAAAKAAEVRKLKMEKQGVLGQINVIESKKKALVEIRQSVEARSQELYDQLVKDREAEEARIRNKTYSTVELGSDGQPTEAAKTRREKQVIKSYEDLTNKFFADAEAVKKSTEAQDAALLSEIRADQKALALVTTRTVSSMGDELKVSFGTYEGSKNGWNAYLSLYSDGVLLYTDNFIVNYEALSRKKAPDMATEIRDSVIEEYTNNVDIYNSLLTRGDPIIYFEIDYTARAENDEKPSEYKFNFDKIRVINTLSGKSVQTSTLGKVQPRTMKPEWDLRPISGVVEKEKETFLAIEKYIAKGKDLASSKALLALNIRLINFFGNSKMIAIPGKNIEMLSTEVTQKTYQKIMGENPSYFKGENNPVENVSWYDAIYFCNMLSYTMGLTPAYSVTLKDLSRWEEITLNLQANGFRLPTLDEWIYAAKGGQNYRYAGSKNLDKVGWYYENCGGKTHPVAQKKPNAYGLYDMSGNVGEWVWDPNGDDRYVCGGSVRGGEYYCEVGRRRETRWDSQSDDLGFRIVRSF
ncbi:SUMF1/EgtB/PvdO family nonheme iron enzyme [uncultured Treponema sp.]|uniref:SUMF1/EgtB/PvdO family nonheme iron enzyme n=1 Tax=uncultured Treponema sp. TaxID=162155 RepID=UPI0025FED77D|nr:SUMF1/EgtB/PvdO family nonheme iron enzyme [uncultured Treponema sp.]